MRNTWAFLGGGLFQIQSFNGSGLRRGGLLLRFANLTIRIFIRSFLLRIRSSAPYLDVTIG